MADPADVLPEIIKEDDQCRYTDELSDSSQCTSGGLCGGKYRISIPSSDLLSHSSPPDIAVQTMPGLYWTAAVCGRQIDHVQLS